MQNTIRTTALLFFIMVLALMTTVKKVDDLPVGFIAISLGLNWMLMLYFGGKLRRFKIWLYPLMFILNPFYNWYYMVYGIFTAGQRTWGGPRADAAAADSHTTARKAAEQAEKQGDELNVVPETFKAAHEARRAASNRESTTTSELGRSRSVVRPPDKIDGKFSARQKTASGTYAHPDEIDASAENVEKGRRTTRGFFAARDSLDSIPSIRNVNLGVGTPRRMKLLMNDENLRKYQLAQQMQSRISGTNDAEGMYRQPTQGVSALPRGHSASANDIPLYDLGVNNAAAPGTRSEDIQRSSEGRGISTRADNERSRHEGNLSFAGRMASMKPKPSR
jgi:chitin synthase